MRVKTVKDLGLLIRDQRRARGWSQTQLAQAAGVSRLWIGNLENGKQSLDAALVFKTLRVLDIVVDVSLRKTNPLLGPS